MFLLAISETTVGLSLSIYHWKVVPEQNINMKKIFQQHYVVDKFQEDENMHFCPKEPAFSKFSQKRSYFCQSRKHNHFHVDF